MIQNIINRIRLLSNARKEPYLFWYGILGFYPNNVALYTQALSHKTAPIVAPNGKKLTNERLEFLGDAILSAIFSEILYLKYPDKSEGFLSNARAKVVCRSNLNNIARKMNLHKYVHSSLKNEKEIENLFGNAFEALIGAIYLDKGYDSCCAFIDTILTQKRFLHLERVVNQEVDFKSRLIEWGHSCRKEILFEHIGGGEQEKGTRANFVFQITVDGVVWAQATGKNKLEAQQRASKIAFQRLKTRGNKRQQ